MAKLKYNHRLKNFEKRSGDSNMSAIVLKGSIHRVMAQSSRESERYLQTMRLADNTVISQTADSANDIKYGEVVERLELYLDSINKRNVGKIDVKDSVISNLFVKETEESLATGISVNSNGRFESNKIYNIRFNIIKFIGAMVGFGATAESIMSGGLCGAICAGIAAVLSLVDSTTIELDDNCGKILQIMYFESDQEGINRDNLIRIALEKGYMSESEINVAINSLIKYRCIKINKKSLLEICESINISGYNNTVNA